MIISVTSATLLSVGLSQVPSNEIGTVPTEVSAATKTKVIGANSAVYKKTGKKTKKVIKAGKKIHVYGQKTINGKLYYKIGKNEYIRASNVDGKKLKAAKNTVLYTRSGKVIKNSKVRKGQGIKVYGSVVTINGKKYYSTKYGYIKVSALAKKEKPVQPNNNTQNSTGNNSGSNGSAGSNGSTSNGSGSNGSTSNGSGSNGSSSNGSGSNGSTSNGSGSNGSTSNGSGSNGSTSNGSGSNGSTSNGSGSNGSTSNGSGSNGSTSNGSGSNGSTSNGSGSNGATPNGSAEPQK